VDKDRLNKILDNLTESKNIDLTETEERLRELKEQVMKDLANRQILMEELAELIDTEKDNLFAYENSNNFN
jgi:hypothetical protein